MFEIFRPPSMWPSTGKITDEEVRTWATRLRTLLDEAFRKVALMPFNRSTQADVADTGNADTEFTVLHNLSRVPKGYGVTYTDAGGVVYDSGTAWTAVAIYLKCSAANAHIKVLIF